MKHISFCIMLFFLLSVSLCSNAINSHDPAVGQTQQSPAEDSSQLAEQPEKERPPHSLGQQLQEKSEEDDHWRDCCFFAFILMFYAYQGK